MIKERRYFRFKMFQEPCFLFFQGRHLQYPKTGLVAVYLDKVVLIVTAEYKLAKEFHLPFVLALGFQFIDIGSTQVFNTFGEFLFVEQHLVYTYEKLVCPVRIELATETIIGQISHVVIEQGLHPFEESTLASRAFRRDQAQNRQYLNRTLI